MNITSLQKTSLLRLWQAYKESIEKFEIEEYQAKFIGRIFRRYDKDGDGYLSDKELGAFLSNCFSEKFLSLNISDVIMGLKKKHVKMGETIDLEKFISMFADGLDPELAKGN